MTTPLLLCFVCLLCCYFQPVSIVWESKKKNTVPVEAYTAYRKNFIMSTRYSCYVLLYPLHTETLKTFGWPYFVEVPLLTSPLLNCNFANLSKFGSNSTLYMKTFSNLPIRLNYFFFEDYGVYTSFVYLGHFFSSPRYYS